MTALLAFARRNPPLTAAAVVLVTGGGAIAAAWLLELAVGLVPCSLCLTQRVPYYLGLPLAAAAVLGAQWGAPAAAVRAALAVAGLAMATTAVIAAYHAGVEWHLWPGPADCASVPLPQPGSVSDLLAQMKRTRLVRCDEPAWVVLGLSLAGWNALISAGLAGVAAWGATARPRA